MPYANREQQLQAMRAWRARQKRKRAQAEQRRGQLFGLPDMSPLQPPTSPPATSEARRTGWERAYMGKESVGWRGPDGQVIFSKERPQEQRQHTPSPPQIAPAPPRQPPASPRRQRLSTYQRLRDRGLDETAAKRELLRQRGAEQQKTKESRREQQIATRVPQFLGAARAYLSRAGVYREDAVPQVARAMAERSVLLQQPPLLQSPETLLLPSVAGGLVPVTTGCPKTDYRRVFPLPRTPQHG